MQLRVPSGQKALTGCQGLAGSALQDGGVTSEHETLQLLFVIMPAHHLLYMEICVLILINLRSIPLGWQPLKNNNNADSSN